VRRKFEIVFEVEKYKNLGLPPKKQCALYHSGNKISPKTVIIADAFPKSREKVDLLYTGLTGIDRKEYCLVSTPEHDWLLR